MRIAGKHNLSATKSNKITVVVFALAMYGKTVLDKLPQYIRKIEENAMFMPQRCFVN
jgi:hypothetical protein